LQVAWAGDWYFSGFDRMSSAVELIRGSQSGRTRAARYAGYRSDFVQLGKSLPPNARVLLHNQHAMLGIDRTVLLDLIGFQGVIDYRPLKSVCDVDAAYRALGVTHVAWTPGASPASDKQSQILFDVYAGMYLKPASFGRIQSAPLPAERPARATGEMQIVTWGLAGYANGSYRLGDLGACEWYPPELIKYPAPRQPADNDSLAGALRVADAALIAGAESLPPAAAQALQGAFTAVNSAGNFQVFARKPGAAVEDDAQPLAP
jgi:hypothetical protein